MGIAEAIAITRMVTANIFAISPAFGRNSPALIESPGLPEAIHDSAVLSTALQLFGYSTSP
jgi:hypothetical protein